MTQEQNEAIKLEEIITGLPSVGPGQRLRQVREARNIGLEEVAKNLRLSPQRVALIEADKYEAMGASAFARGYLRSYARFLDIPEEEILNTFGESGLASEIQSNKPKLIHEKMVQHVHPSIIRRIIYLIFLAALIMAGFWWNNHVNGDKNAAEDKTTSSIGELNQQGVSQVVDPQGATGAQQPLPVQVLNPENGNTSASETPTTQVNSAVSKETPVSPKRTRGGVGRDN